MQITLNLASRPFADLRPVLKSLRITLGALAVLALALGVLLHYVEQRDEQANLRAHQLDAAIAAMNTERAGYDTLMRQPANTKVLDQTDALNSLFDEKAFSWTLVMKDLEKVLPAAVELSQIEPVRTKDGKVTLHLRVVGPHEQAILLVENMERSDRFRLPRIVGEGPQSSGNPNEAMAPISASTPEELDLLTDYNLAPPSEVVPANYTLTAKVENAALDVTARPMLRKPEAGKPEVPRTMAGGAR